MTSGLTINPAQLRQLQADFKRLEDNVRPRKLLSALKDAGKPVVAEVKRLTPARSGGSRKSAGWKKDIKSVPGTFGIRLHGDYKYNFLENGTKPRRQKSTGRFTGSGPAYAPQRKAFDAKSGEAVERFASSMQKIIDKHLKR